MGEAYRYCERLARSHYENFTVGSILLGRERRRHLAAIYAFCRWVDDLGDEAEGDRVGLLQWWEEELDRCYAGRPSHLVMVALADTVEKFDIPEEPFRKLIEANRRDQRKRRYETFAELLEYCDHSANPVGRLFLYLFGYRDSERQRLSDCTCTALQLTNFWQDIVKDLEKDRIYIPREDLERFNYTEEQLQGGVVNGDFRRLMAFELSRTRELFQNGLELVGLVDRGIAVDVELFSRGGMAILDKIEDAGCDVFRQRPQLSKLEKLWLLLSTVARRRPGGKRDGKR